MLLQHSKQSCKLTKITIKLMVVVAMRFLSKKAVVFAFAFASVFVNFVFLSSVLLLFFNCFIVFTNKVNRVNATNKTTTTTSWVECRPQSWKQNYKSWLPYSLTHKKKDHHHHRYRYPYHDNKIKTCILFCLPECFCFVSVCVFVWF